MIFERPTNLWIGFLGALFNVAVLFHVAGFNPTPEQIVGANAMIFAAVGLIANSTTAPLRALNGKARTP